MINTYPPSGQTYQPLSVETDYTEPFEDRIDTLFRELELAVKWRRPSVLLAVYNSEYVRADAEMALQNRLQDLGQRTYHVRVKSQEQADVAMLISSLPNLGEAVILVDGLRWGGGDDNLAAYHLLNNQREFFVENQVRVVFWLTETEAIDLAHYAPDYWAFRHRVIEFVDAPRPEQISPHALEAAWQGIGDFIDSTEDLDARIALRTALLDDLPDGNESTAPRANLLLTLGMLQWRRGDYDKAHHLLDLALELAAMLQDDCFEALCFNAMALVETDLGRIEEAIQAYQNAAELAPDQVSPWNNLGLLYRKLDQHEQALAAFQKAIEHDASDAISWNGLGELYCILGRDDDAIYAFLKATELSPELARSWSGLGNTYAHQGRLEDALAAHQKAIELDRRTSASWLGLGDIYRAQGNNEKASLAYQTAVEVDPANANAWSKLGNIYYETEAFDEAAQAYEKALEHGHPCAQSFSNLASIYVHKGRHAEAVPLLKKGIELSQDAADRTNLWNRLGDVYRKLDDYDSAIAAYRAADHLDVEAAPASEPAGDPEANIHTKPLAPPKDEPLSSATEPKTESSPLEERAAEPTEPDETAQALDASTLSGTTNTEGAVPSDEIEPASLQADGPTETTATSDVSPLDDTIPIKVSVPAGEPHPEPIPTEPDIIEWLDGLGNTAPVAPQPEELLPEVQEPPNTEPVEGDRAASEAPTLPEPAESPETEVDDSQPASELPADETTGLPQERMDAQNAQIWNELGHIYYGSGAYDEAILAFSKAIELNPSYGWAYTNLAAIYTQRGRYAEALPLYQKAIQLLGERGDQALLWNRLGDVYRRLDEQDNAAAAYRKAVELDPDNVSLLTRARFSLLGNRRP